MNKLIDAVRTFLSGVEYIEQEENANYVVTKEDKELLKEAIDTVVKALEKPLSTDDCTHPFNEVDRCEGIIYFCNVCNKYVYKEETK